MVKEWRRQNRRFEDDRLEMVWAALQTLDVSMLYVVLRELATELNAERLDPRSPQGRVRAAILALNHATDFLGEVPSQSAYRELRERRPDLRLMPDTTVRRLLGGSAWQDCLRRALLAAPSEGDFVKRAGGQAFTEAEVLQALRDCLADRKGDVPTFEGYLAWVCDPAIRARPGRRPVALSVFIRFGGFRACLVRLGVDVKALQRVDKAGRVVPLRRGYTDAEMFEAVRAVAVELGRTPKSSEYRDAREAAAKQMRAGQVSEVRPSLTALVERFGSWAEVVAEAGLPPLELAPRPRPVGRRRLYSDEERLEWIRKAWVDLGAPLTPDSYESWRRRLLDDAHSEGRELRIPTCDSISRAFGGWRRARAQALPEEPL